MSIKVYPSGSRDMWEVYQGKEQIGQVDPYASESKALAAATLEFVGHSEIPSTCPHCKKGEDFTTCVDMVIYNGNQNQFNGDFE